MSDIRKWFMKAHAKNNAAKPADNLPSSTETPAPEQSQPEKTVHGGEESSGRRKNSNYFATDKQKPKDESQKKIEELPVKRKAGKDSEPPKPPPSKKLNIVEDDDDFVPHNSRKNSVDATPSKKLKSDSGRGVAQKTMDVTESDEDEAKATESPLKSAGRGRGGRGASATSAGGRGRGGGRGFMNFGERKDPPHKGEKEVPEGAPNCSAGFTFVISGTLDSLEREEAEDLIKRHGCRITGSVSKKMNYLLCDEHIGGRKSAKAKELGTAFVTEDGLFDMIRASNCGKVAAREESKKPVDNAVVSLPKKSPQKVESKKDSSNNSSSTKAARKVLASAASLAKQKDQNTKNSSLTWTEKYKPKTPNDIIGNQSLVKQLHDWSAHWNEQFLDTGKTGKGKKQSDSGAKKAVLLSGTPGKCQ